MAAVAVASPETAAPATEPDGLCEVVEGRFVETPSAAAPARAGFQD